MMATITRTGRRSNRRVVNFLGGITDGEIGVPIGSDLPAIEYAGWALPLRSDPEGTGETGTVELIFSDIF
jgi:hypothetical protein